MSLRSRLPALESKDYRLWFAGQSVSLIGTWLQNTGQAWLVLKLTSSPFKLGLLTSVQFLPSLLLSLFIGPVVDRYPKRSLLLFTQTMFAITALALAAVAFSGHAAYWQVFLIAAVTGVITAIDGPTRQAFVSEQVHDRSAVTNAVALNSTMFNMARVIGPAVGGILIDAVGIPWTFILNAVSFIAVIISLVFMQAGRSPVRSVTSNYLADVGEGIRYIRKNQVVMSLLTIAGVISMFLLNFNILIPSFTQLTLGLEADGFGGLMSAMGMGALAAGLLMSLGGKRLEPRASYIYISGFMLSIAMILVGVQRSFYLSGVLLFFCGFGMAAISTMCNTGLQMQAPDVMRGRVMAAYNLVYVGSTPIGALYAGKISDALGANMGFLVSGAIGFVFLVYMRVFVTPHTFGSRRTLAAPAVVTAPDFQTVQTAESPVMVDARSAEVDRD